MPVFVVADVRIPTHVTHINRGSWSLRTLGTADDELAHIRRTLDFKKENNNGNKRKSLGTDLERSRLALERWQGLHRRRLLSQRAYRSGSRTDEARLRNHLRQPQRQRVPSGCAFRGPGFLRRGRGQA